MNRCYTVSRKEGRRKEYPTYHKKKKANCIGHILRSNCLLKHANEGKVEVTGRRGRRRKQLLDDIKEKEWIIEIERDSTGSHRVENSLWKRLWTCRTREWMNELINERMNEWMNERMNEWMYQSINQSMMSVCVCVCVCVCVHG
jgi:hypothetical protein